MEYRVLDPAEGSIRALEQEKAEKETLLKNYSRFAEANGGS